MVKGITNYQRGLKRYGKYLSTKHLAAIYMTPEIGVIPTNVLEKSAILTKPGTYIIRLWEFQLDLSLI